MNGHAASAGYAVISGGVHSRAAFLADPEAQEKALTDYLNDKIRRMRAIGVFARIGETIDALKARFPVTRAGIIAAAHRECAIRKPITSIGSKPTASQAKDDFWNLKTVLSKHAYAPSQVRGMSNFSRRRINPLLAAATLATFIPILAHAQMLSFSKRKSTDQVNCLEQALRLSRWQGYAGLPAQMVKIASVASTILNNRGQRDDVYILKDGIDWCAIAGCKLLIAERERNGSCRLLYDGTGDKSFTVLRHRDHGYRRIYAPCEARFDGRAYRQVREECPNPDVHH